MLELAQYDHALIIFLHKVSLVIKKIDHFDAGIESHRVFIVSFECSFDHPNNPIGLDNCYEGGGLLVDQIKVSSVRVLSGSKHQAVTDNPVNLSSHPLLISL